MAIGAAGWEELQWFARAGRVGEGARPQPRLRVRLQSDVVQMGAPLLLSWTSHLADRIDLTRGGIAQGVAREGQIALDTSALGRFTLTLEAHGAGGVTREEIVYRVEAPPLTWKFPLRQIEALPGGRFCIEYAVNGARTLALRCPEWFGDQIRALPAQGRIDAGATSEARLVFEASGWAGKSERRIIQLQLLTPDMPNISSDLDHIYD